MKRHAALLLAALLLAWLIAVAAAEAPGEDGAGHFVGKWVGDGYMLYIRREGDEVFSRLTRRKDNYTWELDRCWYDADEARLYCPNCIRYREYIDWDTLELVQDDWSLSDLVFAWFTLTDDGDTLTACDIPHIDGPLTLSRVSDEEPFGF